MRVAELYTKEEIAQQPVAQIPWGTLIEITYKCQSKESRLWYINKTYENSWSRSNLIKQIKAKAYERNTIEPIVSKGIKDYDNPLINEMIKESYDEELHLLIYLFFLDKPPKLLPALLLCLRGDYV